MDLLSKTERTLEAAWKMYDAEKLATKRLRADLTEREAQIAVLREALLSWVVVTDNAEECEFGDMASYVIPMPLFCDADEATTKALADPPQTSYLMQYLGEPVAYMTYKGILLHAEDPKVAGHSEPEPLYALPRKG